MWGTLCTLSRSSSGFKSAKAKVRFAGGAEGSYGGAVAEVLEARREQLSSSTVP